MNAYSQILAIGQARLLLLAMVPVRLGYAMAGLAMVLLVRERTGSFAVAGLALGLFSLGAGLLSPLRGHLLHDLGLHVATTTRKFAGTLASHRWVKPRAVCLCARFHFHAGIASPRTSPHRSTGRDLETRGGDLGRHGHGRCWWCSVHPCAGFASLERRSQRCRI